MRENGYEIQPRNKYKCSVYRLLIRMHELYKQSKWQIPEATESHYHQVQYIQTKGKGSNQYTNIW